MIKPPFFGTFSKPENSIFQKTRLTPPTIGRMISRTHCGNIVRPVFGCDEMLLAGDVPLLLKAFFVETFLIDSGGGLNFVPPIRNVTFR